MMDKYELINKVITLLNELNISGVKNVLALSNVFQMLSTLQKGLKDEDSAKDKTIELLKEQLKRATTPEPPDDGGDVIGGEHYELNYSGGAENGTN